MNTQAGAYVRPIVMAQLHAGTLRLIGAWPDWTLVAIDIAMTLADPDRIALDDDWAGFVWSRRGGVLEARVHLADAGVATAAAYDVVDVADRCLLLRRRAAVGMD